MRVNGLLCGERQVILIPKSCLCRIVASLVRARPLEFFYNILRWLLVAIPATWTNSWLSYIQNKLAIAYRTRLTERVLKDYLGEEGEGAEGKVYYKLCKCPYCFLKWCVCLHPLPRS